LKRRARGPTGGRRWCCEVRPDDWCSLAPGRSGARLLGRSFLGNERTTFIIDPAGKVAEVLRKVKPAEHDDLVLKALAEAAPVV